MEYFGWLTKGHYQVSFLDRLIFLGEVIFICAIGIMLYSAYDYISRLFK